MRYTECETCQRLWRAYAQATYNHIRAIGQQEIAATEHDFAKVERLEEELRKLEVIRNAARDGMRDHEKEADSKAAAAGTLEGTGGL